MAKKKNQVVPKEPGENWSDKLDKAMDWYLWFLVLCIPALSLLVVLGIPSIKTESWIVNFISSCWLFVGFLMYGAIPLATFLVTYLFFFLISESVLSKTIGSVLGVLVSLFFLYGLVFFSPFSPLAKMP